MVKVINFQVKELPRLWVVGKALKVDMKIPNPIPEFWGQCFKEEVFNTLETLSQYHLDNSYVGWMGDWQNEDGTFTYLCGMLMKVNTPLSEGFTYREIAKSKVAISWIQGLEAEVYPKAHELSVKELEANGYQAKCFDWSMELYNCPRYTQQNDKGEIILDYYLPLKA